MANNHLFNTEKLIANVKFGFVYSSRCSRRLAIEEPRCCAFCY